jgi:hypothetical protein
MTDTSLLITVDGCDCVVTATHEGDVITVCDTEGTPIGEAELDSAVKTVYGQYYDEVDGWFAEFTQSDLYEKPLEEIASWIISTHPRNAL